MKTSRLSTHRVEPDDDESDFGVELSESLPTKLNAMRVSDSMLTQGNTLRDMHMPEGSLVMMIKRGNDYIVPNGNVEILKDDMLLIIKETNKTTTND